MPAGERLHEIFAVRAREAPDRVAVAAPDPAGARQITYGELDARAGRLARRLIELGVGPEALVGLCAERGIEMIVGLLAIAKAGGAYVPIDPAYPEKRIGFLLADSATGVVVATRAAAPRLAGCDARAVIVDEIEVGQGSAGRGESGGAEPAAAADENLAYVIYTSGSTGTPKGVLVEHRNVVRLFGETRRPFQLDERDVWTLFHSISFDFSVWEIWGALLHGARLVIVPAEVTRSPEQLLALVREEGVTVLNQTPSAFRQLVALVTDPARQAPVLPLRLVIFGGEALEVGLLEPWIARHGDRRPVLVNMYGITETTVHVTARRIAEADLRQPGVSPIGAPLADLEIHLLDEAGREVPDGAAGEICVAGAGLARGYLNRPDLTAERFVPAPGGRRLYRSGDRARRLTGGDRADLAYLGRTDDQMKVRGFRIEPREIEACLLGHPEVATAIAVQQDYGDGDRRLTAFVVPRTGRGLTPEKIAELTAALAERAAAELPAHLRPSAYRVLSEVPTTPQGKVDREALRQRTAEDQALGQSSAPASEQTPEAAPSDGLTTTERAILEIVEEALQRRGIGLHDDLFDVGGTSMTLIRVLRRANQRFDVALNGSELGEEATVARLAQCVDAAAANP
jgi:amino acid adenylation domain-containing protein